MKKFVCPVCGYVYEGDEMPADSTAPCVRSRLQVRGADRRNEAGRRARVRHLREDRGQQPRHQREDKAFILEQLKANFTGECSEVGMYLCMGPDCPLGRLPRSGPVLGEGRFTKSRARRQVC